MVFLDESGFMLTPTVRRTFAPRGQTPLIKSWDRHDRISAISAVTVSPKRRRLGLYFHLMPDDENVHASGHGVELARVTVTRAYILSIIPGAAATLAFTADGGFSWSTRAVPCSDPFDLGAEIALSSTNDLWLVCGGQASAGSQAKALYRSSTGGLTWSLVAQTAAFAGAPVPSPGAGLLPLEGYVAPYSIGHKNLNVLSANLAWLFPTRGNVITTTDGGASWNAVPGLEEESFGSGAPGNLTFISATTGWVAELGVGLWHTTDGTNWLALGT